MRIVSGTIAQADVTDRTARDLGFVREFFYNEVKNGRAFIRGIRLVPGAGNFGEVQLLNPAASGKTIDIAWIFIGAENSDEFQLRTHDVALATLVGVGVNLNYGGAAGVGEVRTATPVAQDGTQIASLFLATTGTSAIPFVSFGTLAAGKGIIISPRQVNENLNMSYVWTER